MNFMFDSLSTRILFQQAPSVLPPNPGNFPVTTGRRLNILGAIEGASVSSGDPWLVSYSALRRISRRASDLTAGGKLPAQRLRKGGASHLKTVRLEERHASGHISWR